MDWNALHRDLYGDLVFPLQVVVGLDAPGADYTGGEFMLVEQRARAQFKGSVLHIAAGLRADLHHQGPPGAIEAGAGRAHRCGTASAGCVREGRRTLGLVLHDAT